MSRPRTPGPRDDGFSLVESMVALAVFTTVALSSAGLLLNILSTAGSSTRRVVAANLAESEVERFRTLRALDIPDGGEVRTVRVPDTAKGIRYRVERTSNYVTAGATTSVCAGTGSTIIYKLVTVTVTWDRMGSAKPVRSDVLKALGLGTDGLAADRGVAVVGVVGATGAPVSGVTVALAPTGGSRTTGVDGCAVFADVVPGSYSATVNQSGYTDQRGSQLLQRTGISVTAQQVTRTSLTYDRAGVLRVTPVNPAGHSAPADLALTLSSSLLSDGQSAFSQCTGADPTRCLTGTPVRTASRLFPGVYGAWAGLCGPDPLDHPTVRVQPGLSSDVQVPLAALTVDLRNSGGAPLVGSSLHLLAVPPSGTACSERYTVPSSAGTVQTALPAGSWQLSLTADGSGAPPGGWPVVTVDPAGPAAPRQTVTSP